jgi:actin related protein 2/3 complex subunit 5
MVQHKGHKVLMSVEDRCRKVTDLLSKGLTFEALVEALTDPPVTSKDKDVKDMQASAVLRTMGSFKDKEIKKTVGKIPAELMDTLMKYIYRGLQTPSNASALLKWHMHATTRSGVGSIVRVLTDRKTV